MGGIRAWRGQYLFLPNSARLETLRELATQMQDREFSSARIHPQGTLLFVDERTLRVKGHASNAPDYFPESDLIDCPLAKLIGTAGSRAIRKLQEIPVIGTRLEESVMVAGMNCEVVIYPSSRGFLAVELVRSQDPLDRDATSGLYQLTTTQSLEELYRNFVSMLKERFKFEHSILLRVDEFGRLEPLAESLRDGVARGLAPLSGGRSLSSEVLDALLERPVGLLSFPTQSAARLCMSPPDFAPLNLCALRTVESAFQEFDLDGKIRSGAVSAIEINGKLWGVVVLLRSGEGVLGHTDRVGLSSLTKLFPILYRNIIDLRLSKEVGDGYSVEDAGSPFARAFRLSTCGMTLCSLNGQVMTANPSICEILGLNPDRLIGDNFLRFVHPDEQFAYARYCRKLLNGESCKSEYTVRLVSLDGSIVRVQMNMAVSRDASGEPQYFVTQYTNLTELLEAKERQSQIQNNLMRLQRLESLGTFAGGIAHDFNNMLASLYGYLELLELETAQDGCQDLLVRALEACRSGQEMVESLLSFTRQKTWQVSESSLLSVLHEVYDLSSRQFPDWLKFELDAPSQDITLSCDPTQLSQMLQNLVYNAYQAAADYKRIEAEVQLRLFGLELAEARELNPQENEVSFFSNYLLAAGSYAVFQVSDNGPGLTEDILEHIFEPFFSTKDPGKGTGLGLSVVFGIVERHNGTISVISKPGQGTRFSVYLPFPSSGDETETKRGVA
ncbi:MAG TPA: PAS domain S-box protein [Phycisphaerales bacterium]|nr:PAS domain S-box protein [Phycisphaerales bacterium]